MHLNPSLYYTKSSLGWTLMLFQKPYYHASLMMSSWYHLIHVIHSLSATRTISPRHLLLLNTHVIRHVTFSPTTFYHISLQPRQHHTTKLQFRPYTLYIYNCTPTLSLFPFWPMYFYKLHFWLLIFLIISNLLLFFWKLQFCPNIFEYYSFTPNKKN
jgi:hypothetical protein